MDSSRAQTLEALDDFIKTQKALLARTRKDIDHLARLKQDALRRSPDSFIEHLVDELDAGAFRLGDVEDIASLAILDKIDWSLYDRADPAPLEALRTSLTQQHFQQTRPLATQRSELSELQKLVKEARGALVDPVLARLEAHVRALGSGEGEEEEDPEEARREREREKLKELKRRRIVQDGPAVQGTSTSTRRPAPAALGVFVRRDVEDESGEVEIEEAERMDVDPDVGAGVVLEQDGMGGASSVIGSSLGSAAAASSRGTSLSRVGSSDRDLRRSASAATRVRRPSAKMRSQSRSEEKGGPSASAGARKAGVSGARKNGAPGFLQGSAPDPGLDADKNEGEDSGPEDEVVKAEHEHGRKGGKPPKPRSETYKQAWSVSEQHLLEQLLEQIPEGEKNRWQKISRAMQGRRTPRQVASRVQKYFEKLKRFGLR